ncbi:hypothetical protein [Lentzea sp.]
MGGLTLALALHRRADLVSALRQALPAGTVHFGRDCAGAETRLSRAGATR